MFDETMMRMKKRYGGVGRESPNSTPKKRIKKYDTDEVKKEKEKKTKL